MTILTNKYIIDTIIISISEASDKMNIDYFTNDKYKVLSCMAERQIEVAGFVYAPLSQWQVADITGIAFGTVNTIIKDLKNKGYIEYNGATTRGKYSLTDKARTIITQIGKKRENHNE